MSTPVAPDSHDRHVAIDGPQPRTPFNFPVAFWFQWLPLCEASGASRRQAGAERLKDVAAAIVAHEHSGRPVHEQRLVEETRLHVDRCVGAGTRVDDRQLDGASDLLANEGPQGWVEARPLRGLLVIELGAQVVPRTLVRMRGRDGEALGRQLDLREVLRIRRAEMCGHALMEGSRNAEQIRRDERETTAGRIFEVERSGPKAIPMPPRDGASQRSVAGRRQAGNRRDVDSSRAGTNSRDVLITPRCAAGAFWSSAGDERQDGDEDRGSGNSHISDGPRYNDDGASGRVEKVYMAPHVSRRCIPSPFLTLMVAVDPPRPHISPSDGRHHQCQCYSSARTPTSWVDVQWSVSVNRYSFLDPED